MRLDKFLSSQTDLSRKDAKAVLRQGLVSVNGQVCKDPAAAVDPAVDSVLVGGTPLSYQEHLYLMLNKPADVVSATEDRSRTTVLDLVPEELFRDGLFPAGRLDADTTGFVLLTDDGAFAHDILSPKHHVTKTYVADLAEPVTDECLRMIREGIELKDGTRCLPATVRVLGETTVELELVEGKYHQIKRMVAAGGNRVVALRRTAIGGVVLDERLEPGACRELTAEELEQLKNRPKP
ncbi:MAG: rRNA pseudouridine synthase [Clostridia bacterium]|nr:rRNA pseudouridine synthase [Clostridia bacterium]